MCLVLRLRRPWIDWKNARWKARCRACAHSGRSAEVARWTSKSRRRLTSPRTRRSSFSLFLLRSLRLLFRSPKISLVADRKYQSSLGCLVGVRPVLGGGRNLDVDGAYWVIECKSLISELRWRGAVCSHSERYAASESAGTVLPCWPHSHDHRGRDGTVMRYRPNSRITTAEQRHDSLAFARSSPLRTSGRGEGRLLAPTMVGTLEIRRRSVLN
jgi:hypothetical protein